MQTRRIAAMIGICLIAVSCKGGISDLISDKKPLAGNPGAATGVVKITQTGGGTTATEGGAGDNYTVVLASQPSASVTITISGGSQLTVSPLALVFTTGACPGAGNWCNAQTVAVAAIDDAAAESTHTGTITHTASSTDPAFNGATIANVAVTITDNDSPGVSITESGGGTSAAEGGGGDTYTVVLTFAPTANVTITLSGGSQATATPSPLTFTTGSCPGTGNWCTAQTVTVNAVDDGAVEGTHSGSVSHAAASGDTGYNNIAIGNVSVTIADNDGVSPIYLFKSASTVNGSMGGRAGVDGTCATSRGALTFPNNSCSTVKAFISINNTGDDIASMVMPGGRTINGPTGILFQNDWTDLLNGVETTTAADAAILPAATAWWSLSSAAAMGLPPAQNCTNGTSTSGTGRSGQSDGAGGLFYATGASPSCGTSYYLLCLCY